MTSILISYSVNADTPTEYKGNTDKDRTECATRDKLKEKQTKKNLQHLASKDGHSWLSNNHGHPFLNNDLDNKKEK